MKKWNYLVQVFLFLGLIIGLCSCEEKITPDTIQFEEAIVVEGYIESGEAALPPYVLLTKELPFIARLSAEGLSDIFIHDATVTVKGEQREINLQEICWYDFSEEERQFLGEILGSLGQNPDSLNINFCAYVPEDLTFRPREGARYELRIEAGEQVLTASTTIPIHVPIDTVFSKLATGDDPQDWREVRGFLDDPMGVENYYRYFTSVNGNILLAPVNSVVDDALFDGKRFEFPIAKAEDFDEEVDIERIGLYNAGDTVLIKWVNIDEEHFRFWSTLEFNTFNTGPFGSYTRVKSNINGGLGIWGGYSVSYYPLIIE